MFKNNFVASIKCDGKILREQDNDTVLLPFLSEYSILLWNKDSRRVSVSVEIDGVNILQSPIILKANEKFDLERFFTNNEPIGRKLRFIEMTKKIEGFRGIQPADGLVRVSFKYEAKNPFLNPSKPNPYDFPGVPGISFNHNNPPLDNNKIMCCVSNHTSINQGMYQTVKDGTKSNSIAVPDYGRPIPDIAKATLRDIPGITSALTSKKEKTQSKGYGITVPGSESSQKHPNPISLMLPDDTTETVIMFQLFGTLANKEPITQPITKKSTKSCPTCGDKWNFNYTYCPSDATFLAV